MKARGVRTKITYLAVLPFLIVAIIFSAFFTIQRFQAIDHEISLIKNNVLTELGPSVKFGLITNNTTLLQLLSRSATENPHLTAMAIFNKSGELLVYSGLSQLIPKKLQNEAKLTSSDYTKFIIPLNTIQHNLSTSNKMEPAKNISSTHLGWIYFDIANEPFRLQKIVTLFLASMILFLGWLIPFIVARLIGKDITENLEDELQTTVDQSTQDLQQNLEAIEIQNVELDLAYKKEHVSNQMKSEFITDLSHEIRTPINSIIGFINLFQESELESFQRDYLLTIKKSAYSLLTLINDILDFSKIEAGKFKLDSLPLDISETIDDVLTLLAPSAQEKGIELIALIDPNIPERVKGDPLRLKQVITNLASNAIKFSDSGNVIVTADLAKATSEQFTIAISVKDNGMGLSKTQQQELFQAFCQINRAAGGTGLGLVITKKLIEQMGGTIGVESQLAKGTTVNFTFTVEKIADATELLKNRHQFAEPIILHEPNPHTRQALHQLLSYRTKHVYIAESIEEITRLLNAHKDEDTLIIIGLADKVDQHFSNIINITKNYSCAILALINQSKQETLQELLYKGADYARAKPISQKSLYQCLNEILINKSKSVSPQNQKISSNNLALNTVNILLAEDDPINVKLITALLNSLSIKVVSAVNGEKALTLAQQENFDLILIDLQMPIVNGYELANKIRKHSIPNNRTPLIAISAYISEEDQKSLYTAGFNDYLVKPVEKHQLSDLINKWVKVDDIVSNEIIDINKLIELSGGKKALALEILTLFIKELPAAMENILAAYDIKNYKRLAELVHQLHGGASYCSTLQLKVTLAALEKALLEENEVRYEDLTIKMKNEVQVLMTFIEEQQLLNREL